MNIIRQIDYNEEAATHLRELQVWASCGELKGVLLRLYLFAVESENYHSTTHLEQKELAKFLETMTGFFSSVEVWSDAKEFVEGKKRGRKKGAFHTEKPFFDKILG